MAKWGEGDPRWIVEERPDATNVNNWHWVEKNATSWSKDKLKELLVGLVIEDDEAFCEIRELTSCEGEATANNRKAKLIFFYEWVLKGTWSGKLKTGKDEYKGKFEIPNLSEENDADEIDVIITLDADEADEAYKVKEMMHKKGSEIIRQRVAKYIKDLKEEYSHDIILPAKGSAAAEKQNKTDSGKVNKAKEEMNKLIINKDESAKTLGARIHTKTFTSKEDFKCRAGDLYRALTDKDMVQAFTGGPATMEVEKGGRFSLMNGHVTGEFIELVPEKKIVQRWRVKTWPSEHYSHVTMDLEEMEDKTVLKLTQKGVPESEYDRTAEGWKVNYWERMKSIFGFGSRLY